MSDATEQTDIATSSEIKTKGFFEAGRQAVESLAGVAADKGLKATSVAAGIVVLIFLIIEFVTTRDYMPNNGEIIGLVIAGTLVIIPMMANSFEYKWRLSANTRKMELITEQLRIEADYKISQLKHTRLEHPKEERDIPGQPK